MSRGGTTAVEIANDVESCVDYLKSKKTVSSNGIGLIGHSAGGLSAAIVSSKNPNIAFTILLATPGISGDEIIYSQTKEILFEGLNEHELEEHAGVANSFDPNWADYIRKRKLCRISA